MSDSNRRPPETGPDLAASPVGTSPTDTSKPAPTPRQLRRVAFETVCYAVALVGWLVFWLAPGDDSVDAWIAVPLVLLWAVLFVLSARQLVRARRRGVGR